MTNRRLPTILSAGIALFLLSTAVGCSLLNRAPVPILSRTPASGEAPLSVFFDGASSVDPDGSVSAYDWSFGDGSSATDSSTTHTYESAGTYEAVLTVTDDQGKQTCVSKMVTVVSATNPVPEGTSAGEISPDFTLPGLLDEEQHSLSDYRGYVVLLDFWGSWCPPCRTSMPHLESLRETYADQGLVMIAVAVDDTRTDAISYLDSAGYTELVALLDTSDQSTRQLYEVESIPRTFIIDRQGIIRFIDHPIRLRGYNIEPWL